MTSALRQRVAGVTLVELMVAISIGTFLLIGAMTVFMQGRTTFRVNDSIGRLQENARFIAATLEPDLRMAGYWGLTSRTAKIRGRATPADPVPAGLAVAGDCGVNWSINLDNVAGGTNNVFNWACGPQPSGVAQPGADTLVVRRVSEDPVAVLQPGILYVESSRARDSQIFTGTVVPPNFAAATSGTFVLRANGYYISANSSLDTPGNPVPGLRMKTLVGGALGPRIVDQEILPGVEDLQVQFGIDMDPAGVANHNSIDRYVNPGDPIITPGSGGYVADARILAIRVWLRLRAERPENGFTDTTNYVYADRNVAAPNDSFRRLVISTTVFLRNALMPT